MKELEYPFDSEYIIKKRKSIKRTLLADGTKRLKKKIAVFGGSTTNDIVVYLDLFLLNNGIEAEFYQSEYAQYWQDAMFPSEELLDFKPDLVFIHTTNRNVSAYPDTSMSKDEVSSMLENEYKKFEQMWQKIADTYHCPVIQNNFEMPFYRIMGNKDCSDYRGRSNYLTRLNNKFYEYADKTQGFYINDINFISASYGLKAWSDPSYWNMYKYAMCVDAIPEFSFNLANIVKSVFGRNKKALALDLDNTLWGGVVGDDGVDGIQIGQETGVAQSYYEFQSYIKSLKSLGIILTVCSKNDHENAIAGLEHPEGALRPDDFIIIKANWENKDRNIIETANELNILPDSIVFVDDNPAERAIVQAQIPGVSAPVMDSVENYITTIDRNGYFEVTNFSDDDLKRNEMYKANAQRAAQQSAFT
ncbi:MAG: HAD-IIIC family phosphatase, partial [Clostridia bacterium]|nr:HAD-IIIC family phosphatase [Clostridia bacterium]